MKKDFPPLNIEIPETVKREDDRLAEDPDAILRLVDLLFCGGGKTTDGYHHRRAVFLSI